MRVETEYEVEDSLRDFGVYRLDNSDHPEFVVNTKDICEIKLVGGKAFNISQLARKGIAVPEGFCITTKAYECFMDFNDISEKDEDIGEKIRDGLMPLMLAEIIRDVYYKCLNGNPCAVRSSSPFEDLKSASFAGQYESFLNIRGEDALSDAVKKCWASLWSPPAVEYRKKMGIESETIGMAVLVQEMIPATASGVLFTEDQITVEAVWGLGDILVGGKALPDRFVVEREEFNVVERTLSHKETMSQMSSIGVGEADVPEHLQDIPVLDDSQLRKLCELGTKVEEFFGCPQDIEWALHDGTIVLLQARPITVKQTQTVWSRANISEMQPGYVTYLSRPPENKPDFFVYSTLPLLECFGIKEVPENVKFVEYIYGHIYLNMTNLHNVLCKVPGLSPDMFDRSIGHADTEDAPGSKLEFSKIVKMLPGALKLIRVLLNLPAQAEQIIPYSLELIENTRHRNLEKLSLEELDNLVWEMYDRNQKVFQIHTCNALAHAAFFDILRKMLKRLGEEGTENLLITGLEGMSSYRLGVEMWKLAQRGSQSAQLSELILSRRENILQELKTFPEGIEFLKDLDEFMEKSGDRCSEEPELSTPRWEENPSFVFSMIAHYLNSTADPVKTLEEEKRLRHEATERIFKKLSGNPFERLIFRKILERTQKDTVTRENLKTAWAKGLSIMRALYLAIASKLVDKDILKNKEDIFYFKMTEVSDVIAGNLGGREIENLIEERRKEKEECEHLDVPMVIEGKPPPIGELKYTVEPKDKLDGVGCSHGVVTGRARVILDPGECSRFKEGEILVASVTDPGWSPLFVIAGGLVMEQGARTSHGVIIAREYGIPAVVGVGNATKIIKTGQLVTVDGNKGLVYIREWPDES